MKVVLKLILLTSLFLICTCFVPAQTAPTAAQTVEKLHAQLVELQDREASLQTRLNELSEALVPENIERSLAGVGSTRPEELREKRRRQLENEKANVLAQLKEIESSRERLTADIRIAEAAAYNESARSRSSEQATGAIGTQAGGIPRWLVSLLAVAISLVGIVVLASLIRKQRRSNDSRSRT